MNPLGPFAAIAGALDLIGSMFGRKRRTRRNNVWFGVLYLGLCAGGIAVLIIVICQLYFAR